MSEHLNIISRRFVLAAPLCLIPTTRPAASQLTIEAHIDALTNQARKFAGLPPLVVSKALKNAARRFADVLQKSPTFSHNADGQTLGQRAQSVQYPFRRLGENLSWTSHKGSPTEIARRTVSGWLESPEHKTNVLGPDFKEFGTGIAQRGARTYAVQIYGAPA